MLITRKHPFTGELNTLNLNVTQEQLDAWRNGELIQNAMPNLSPDEREFILSGITNWDLVLSPQLIDEQEPSASDNNRIPVQAIPEYIPPSKKIYSTNFFRKEKLRQVRPVLKYLSPQVILAGGSLRTILNCAHEEVQDFDLFFTSFSVVPALKERLIEDGWENTFSCPEEKLFSYKKGKNKIQLICEIEYPTAGELISSFDISAGCAALHENTIFFTREFIRSVLTKKLRIMNISFPVATVKRLVKYAQKGYNVSMAAEDYVRQTSGRVFEGDAFRHYID